MKQSLFASTILLFTLPAWAGEIYGTLFENGKPLHGNVAVEVTLGGKVYQGTSGQDGSYRLFIPDKGRGELRVRLGSQSASIKVFSSDNSVRYDLSLQRLDGKLMLQRH